MRVSKIVYHAEDQAGLTADYVRLKLWLRKNGVDQDWTTLEGDSNTMNLREWLVAHGERAGAGIEADELLVEAFDVEINSHVLEVDGKRFTVQLTGALRTATYSFPL